MLRQLAVQDPNNAIWNDDLRAFEQFRMLEIQDEATEALRQNDGERLSRLVAEVEQSGWVNQPSRPLVVSLRKADAQIKAGRAAPSSKTSPPGSTRPSTPATPSAPARRATTGRSWRPPRRSSVTTRWPSASARPSTGSTTRTGSTEITASTRTRSTTWSAPSITPGPSRRSSSSGWRNAVGAHPDGLPETLRQRYITRLRDAEIAETRRRRLVAAGSAAAILVVVGLIYMAARAQFRSAEAQRVATRVGDHLELGELDQAVAELKKLETSDPALLDYAALADVRDRVEAEQKKETDRALQFDQAMRDAETAPPSAKESAALTEARSSRARHREDGP